MKIFVNKPLINSVAKNAVLSALSEGWISGKGPYVSEFEELFAKKVGMPWAVSVANGTTGLHLALATLGLGNGDEVLIPDLTIISCALAPIYLGAKPVLVDVDPVTAGIDITKAEKLVTQKTKAIMVVHLYGQPVLMKPVLAFARKHNLLVIEDCSEAFGAKSVGKQVGSFGDASVFSLYANKIITSGEGGVVLFKKKTLYQKANKLKNLCHSDHTRFLHPEVGFNYRFSNLLAALGTSQLKQSEAILKKKQRICDWYKKGLSKLPHIEFQERVDDTISVCWMFTIRIKKNSPFTANMLANYLSENEIETRFFFVPLHKQPALKPYLLGQKQNFTVSTDLASRGMYLPSGLGHSKTEILHVMLMVKKFISKYPVK